MAQTSPAPTTKRVKILSHIIGRPAYSVGDIVDLEVRIADAWIADGLAILYREDPRPERAVRDTAGVERATA